MVKIGINGGECLCEGDVRGTGQILVMEKTSDFIH